QTRSSGAWPHSTVQNSAVKLGSKKQEIPMNNKSINTSADQSSAGTTAKSESNNGRRGGTSQIAIKKVSTDSGFAGRSASPIGRSIHTKPDAKSDYPAMFSNSLLTAMLAFRDGDFEVRMPFNLF